MGVRIVPPSINASGVDFAVKDGAILYSLAALKNVGAGAIEHHRDGAKRKAAISLRSATSPAASMRHVINKRALESLAKAGAFDCLNPNRRRCSTASKPSSPWPTAPPRKPRRDRTICSASRPAAGKTGRLPAREPWLPMERLAQEFEAVGFYLSGHPLDDYVKPLGQARRR